MTSLGPLGVGDPAALSIALASEHASPLAALGGVDAGGRNVHAARRAGALAGRGHSATVCARRDARDLPDRVPLRAGVEVHHVPAGPPERLPEDELLPHMLAFGRHLAGEWQTRPPGLAHSHFRMSGLASLHATRRARGEGGRRRVLSRYGWPRVAAATESVYAEVPAPRPAATGVI
ncbi:hypothetical protein GCM10010446_31900 [Streptomyces enissocaesilis]|uniref:Glycosyltransferase subfamily 4-like N-terminal domain-containing protein n=1 Tax=Streptomyces enissocaesilis TaxID=332589 RepID=A0ABN3X9I9_9ACTN